MEQEQREKEWKERIEKFEEEKRQWEQYQKDQEKRLALEIEEHKKKMEEEKRVLENQKRLFGMFTSSQDEGKDGNDLYRQIVEIHGEEKAIAIIENFLIPYTYDVVLHHHKAKKKTAFIVGYAEINGMRNFTALVEDIWRENAFYEIIDAMNMEQTVIFCNKNSRVDYLAERLASKKYSVCSISYGDSLDKQEDAMRNFHNKKCRFLVISDSFGKLLLQQIGLEIKFVLSYDQPETLEYYAQRIRCLTNKGTLVSLTTLEEKRGTLELEYKYKKYLETTKPTEENNQPPSN